ncbi:hypothetical protein PG985_005763 [Apiospora marii]|uniref:uncharacterized protein n=1 Tax=Apiospora marii TaxID=335849 RepID=UPI00312D62FC
MADPVSIALGAAGILAPALHWTRLLVEDLRKISDAPSTLKTLHEDVRSVEAALQSLNVISPPQWEALGAAVFEQHSNEGSISTRDRLSLGFVRQDQVKSMFEQLQKYLIALNLIISTATLHSSMHNQTVTEELNSAMTKKDQEISISMTATDQQLVTLEHTFQRFGITGPDDSSSSADEDEAGLRRAMREEQALLRTLHQLLEELKLKNQDEAKKIAQYQKASVQVTFGGNNSGFQLGMNNGHISGVTFGSRGASSDSAAVIAWLPP